MNIQDWVDDVRKNASQDDLETRDAIKEHWLHFAEDIEDDSLKARVIRMAEEIGR